jgi:hypothetical protein
MFALALGLLLATGATTSASASSLIKDGSFEKPVVPVGGGQQFPTGSSIKQWRVVGDPGSSDIVSGAYAQEGFSFPAAKGRQWLDLAGFPNNGATGVQQTVATVPGAAYVLTFSVGNIYFPGGDLGTTSTANVLINGSLALAATNTDGMGANRLVWKAFTLRFTATSASTTVAFINGDPTSDNTNGLDRVKLVAG